MYEFMSVVGVLGIWLGGISGGVWSRGGTHGMDGDNGSVILDSCSL